MDAITAEIEKAKVEVLIQASSLSSRPLADAVIRAKDQGLRVAVVVDRSSAQNGAVSYAALKGILLYIDAKHSVAHSNIIILDREIVITGGFTLTNETEEKSAENFVIIKSRDLAETYVGSWNQHRIHSEEFKPDGPPKGEPRKKDKKKKKS